MTEAEKWTHHALLHDLAEHLRSRSDRMVWTDMQMGPAGSPRPDVFTLCKSFTRPAPLSYEAKISVSDFRRDVTSGKWQSYLQFSSGVIFACPAGLVKKADIPDGCGLIVRHPDGWRMAKGPTLRAVTLPESALLKLLIDGVDRLHQPISPRVATAWDVARNDRAGLAAQIATHMRDLESLQSSIEFARARREKEREEHRKNLAAEASEDRRVRDALADYLGAWRGCSADRLISALESRRDNPDQRLIGALERIQKIAAACIAESSITDGAEEAT